MHPIIDHCLTGFVMLTARQLSSDYFAIRIYKDEEVGKANLTIAVEVEFWIEVLLSALGSKCMSKSQKVFECDLSIAIKVGQKR